MHLVCYVFWSSEGAGIACQSEEVIKEIERAHNYLKQGKRQELLGLRQSVSGMEREQVTGVPVSLPLMLLLFSNISRRCSPIFLLQFNGSPFTQKDLVRVILRIFPLSGDRFSLTKLELNRE